MILLIYITLFKTLKALYIDAVIHSHCGRTLVMVSYMCSHSCSSRLTKAWPPICSDAPPTTTNHLLTVVRANVGNVSCLRTQ